MIVFPNAKINLGLNIISKRDDGFHNLRSLFYPVNLYDVLEILPSDEETSIIITGDDPDVDQRNNIVYKAWKIIHEKFKIGQVNIFLHKIIPHSAGLGGGSSNATFTLIALNKMFNLNLSNKQLFDLSMILGSDCGFFVYNKPAIVEGRGEIITPVKLDLKNYFIILVKPNVNIATAEAFKKINIEKNNFDLINLQNLPVQKWKGNIENDFEDTFLKKYPELNYIKDILYQKGAIYCSLTGSGSSFYGIFNKFPEKNLFPEYFTWIGKL